MQKNLDHKETRCPVSGQTPFEERVNSATHALGVFLSVVACFVLVGSASFTNALNVFGSAVFGVSLCLLYLASTLYHSAKNPVRKRKLKVFDHACIYVLIAGTYTPFALGPLHGPIGYVVLTVIWGLALCGIAFKVYFTGRFKLPSTLTYICMGWIGVFVAAPLAERTSVEALGWILAGGLAYTLGTIFYLGKRIPYNHGLWHLSVLAGSACHFVAVLFFVLR